MRARVALAALRGSRAGPRFAPHSLLRPIARRALSAPPAPKEESQLAGALFFGSIVALTVGLGTWQSQRYTWKVELTERRHANLAQPPVPLSEALADSVDPGSRRVLLRGRFDHAHEVLVGPRPPPKDLPATFTQRETTGFAVVTPFVPNDGGQSVLVLRGWVPKSKLAAMERRGDDEAFVEGVIRTGEEKGYFTPENDVAKRTIRWLEVPAIAQVTGLPTTPAPPVLVEEVRPPTADGQPFTRQLDQLKDFNVTPEKHLVYAVTWFSLAVFGVILTYLRLRKKAPPTRPRPRAA